VVIVDLWESEEDLRRMQENPQFLRNLEAAGWPSEPTEQTHRVHATVASQEWCKRLGAQAPG
jgi:hypothetical protein